MQESIRVNGKDGHDDTVSIDTTVQEKNITYPTDAKLHKKIITKCQQIASDLQLTVRQSYTQTLKKLSRDQRFKNHPRNKAKARKADKKIRTIAGRFEPIIGHVKQDYRLNRNFYKGIVGNNINIMLAASAFNFKRMMNKWKLSFVASFYNGSSF